jgi:CRP/FNR family transcriptional regulator, cyclic AMP receptor protein
MLAPPASIKITSPEQADLLPRRSLDRDELRNPSLRNRPKHNESMGRNAIENARRLLKKCALFRGLPADKRDALSARARIVHFTAGQNIFMMGEPGTSMMAVLNGEVRISVSSSARELILAILHAGEIPLLDGKNRTADAQAVTDCDVAVLNRTDVLDFFHHQPETVMTLVEVLCERLRETDQHFGEVALLRLPVRLAKVLLRIAKVDEVRTPRGPFTRIHVSQRELANMIGGARESVNKCLHEWQQAGIVRVNDSWITIANPAALAEIAEKA